MEFLIVFLGHLHIGSLFSDMFKVGLREMWRQHAKSSPSAVEMPSDADMFSCAELVLSKDDSKVVETTRYPGENDLAMVAWRMSLKTPGQFF